MTDESQEPIESVEEEPTLEDLSKEFSVEEEVKQFEAKPETQAQQQFQPDPIADPDAWNQYSRQQAESISQLSQNYEKLTEKLNSYETQLLQQKVDLDVGKAVSKINEKLNVEPEMAEMALRMTYEKDPNFKKIWDNREANPKAFEKSLGVIANKYSKMFSVKQDPQLTENQMAAKKSLQTSNQKPQTDDYPNWDSQADFDQWWEEHRRG